VSTSVNTLPDLLSLDITAGLVFQGLRAPWKQGASLGDAATFTLNVLDASNTSPIVLTVADGDLGAIDPRTGRVIHIVVSGVLGNTAANKLDEKNQRNEAWVGIITSPTTIALYDLDNSTGALIASTGNGAYASGGTISKALTDGCVLVGFEHVSESSAAPRIVFVPKRFTFDAKATQTSYTAAAFTDGEPERQRINESFRTVVWWYEVHIWGIDNQGAARDRLKKSFGTCELMMEQVLRSAQDRCSACYELGGGTWPDQYEGGPQRVKFGHEMIFQIGLSAPITREPLELSPVDTTLEMVLSLSLAGGAPEEI
jgi:hypothetical protein